MRTCPSLPGNEFCRVGRPHGERGMTLVEMLVVLAIIGVMAGITVLAAGAGTGARATETEARRLVARLQLAADEAMVTDRKLAFIAQDGGYRFIRWDKQNDAWRPDTVEELGALHIPAQDIKLETNTGGRPLPIGADGGGNPLTARFIGSGRQATVTFDGTGARLAMSAP